MVIFAKIELFFVMSFNNRNRVHDMKNIKEDTKNSNNSDNNNGRDDSSGNLRSIKEINKRSDDDSSGRSYEITEIPGYEYNASKIKDVSQFNHKRSLYVNKNYSCPLKDVDESDVSFTNTALLKKFTSERGKILASRITFVCAKHQRKLKREIKRARCLSLLPYLAG